MQEEPRSEKLEIPFPLRPLRILKEPLPLAREGRILFEQQSQRSWKIESLEGPERVREEWWHNGHERDYYRVKSESGEKLWVFQRPEMSGLYLHGIFD